MASTAITRRRLIALLGAGLAAGAAGRSAATGGASPLSLPQRPQRLERVLSHVVGGHSALSVRRGWEVWFAPQGRGIAVSGRQLFAEVNAPPQLAALARIEQQRTETGLFPLMLDADGAILPVADAQGVSEAVTAALGAAEELIARGPGPADQRALQRAYLARLDAVGADLFEQLPRDLFFPTGVPSVVRETLTLPDGLIGSFTVEYRAAPQPDAPWLSRAERVITTRIGAQERRREELWRMGDLLPPGAEAPLRYYFTLRRNRAFA
ncbi:hypothetical protein [Erythrobacter cryptus]|uniref:hypothetical protein n=1 Tax=Erythrobacter cryptus TaxID=196588 RepID=UPI00040A14DA|nr:hypothetical protein [Erythrobacter cryptus]GIX20901.1 MAG: hypothetical protein KatS3mg120_2577 [Erythrobacter sp.]